MLDWEIGLQEQGRDDVLCQALASRTVLSSRVAKITNVTAHSAKVGLYTKKVSQRPLALHKERQRCPHMAMKQESACAVPHHH